MRQLHELKVEIGNKVWHPLYVFIGDEIGIMNIYINKLAAICGNKPVRLSTVTEVIKKAGTTGFITTPQCYIVRDDMDYLKQEKVWDKMKLGKFQKFNSVILLYTKLDKRSKFYKQHSQQLTEFEYLPPEVLSKYVNNAIGMSDRYARALSLDCGRDYTRIMLECDKLKQLQDATGNTNIDDVYEMAMADDLIHISETDILFDFINCILERNLIDLYYLKPYLAPNSTMGALSLIYRGFKNLLLIKACDGRDISKRTGLTPWVVNQVKGNSHRWSISQLVTNLSKIRFMEKGIKTGKVPQELALDYLLVEVL